MGRTNVVLFCALALVLGACSDTPPPVNKGAIEKSVRDVEASLVKATAAKDAAAFAANYASDAIVMAPGMAPMKGPAAIQTGVAGMLADPNFKINFAADRVEVADSGDMAVTRGSYTMTASDPATKKPMTDKGSYVTVYRKQTDGTWKAVLDINTSEVPPPAPPPARKAATRKGRKR